MQRDGDEWVSKIRNLFVFFASSKLKHAFRKHLHHLAVQCRISPSCLLSKFFTEEGCYILDLFYFDSHVFLLDTVFDTSVVDMLDCIFCPTGWSINIY